MYLAVQICSMVFFMQVTDMQQLGIAACQYSETESKHILLRNIYSETESSIYSACKYSETESKHILLRNDLNI